MKKKNSSDRGVPLYPPSWCPNLELKPSSICSYNDQRTIGWTIIRIIVQTFWKVKEQNSLDSAIKSATISSNYAAHRIFSRTSAFVTAPKKAENIIRYPFGWSRNLEFAMARNNVGAKKIWLNMILQPLKVPRRRIVFRRGGMPETNYVSPWNLNLRLMTETDLYGLVAAAYQFSAWIAF